MVCFKRTCTLSGLGCKQAHSCILNVPVTSVGHLDCAAKRGCKDTLASELLLSVSASLNPALRRANCTHRIWVTLCRSIEFWTDCSETHLAEATRFNGSPSNLSPICCLTTAALKFLEGFFPFLRAGARRGISLQLSPGSAELLSAAAKQLLPWRNHS